METETGFNAGLFQEYDYTCEDAECEWKQITEYLENVVETLGLAIVIMVVLVYLALNETN
jgi:hypothetical protein